MKKILRNLALTIFCFFAFIVAWVLISASSTSSLPELKDGDLVFQTMTISQSVAIMMASNSIYTHVGIVKIKANGQPVVIEAVGPVKETDIEDWLEQGLGKFVTVKRIKGLKSEDAKKAFSEAEKYYGKPYDIFFMFGNNEIYCSELVYYAFKDGADIELGKVQKVSDLNINNFAARELIENRWRIHPLCQDSGMNFEFCNKIIMNQALVTPASMAEDERLELVYSNYTPF